MVESNCESTLTQMSQSRLTVDTVDTVHTVDSQLIVIE